MVASEDSAKESTDCHREVADGGIKISNHETTPAQVNSDLISLGAINGSIIGEEEGDVIVPLPALFIFFNVHRKRHGRWCSLGMEKWVMEMMRMRGDLRRRDVGV